MRIQSTHVLEFQNPKTREVFKTKGQGQLQGAPDWVGESDYFKACEKSGWVTDLTPKTVEPEPDPNVSLLRNVVIHGTVEIPERYQLVMDNAQIFPPAGTYEAIKEEAPEDPDGSKPPESPEEVKPPAETNKKTGSKTKTPSF